jgi:hypothetical protein
MSRLGRPAHGPEWYIQRDVITFLRTRGWLVERMVGNAFQYGIPDLYCHHPKWGGRWVEIKNPGKYSFTREQKVKWPVWEKFGCGIWILTGANQQEYDKLFAPPNWREFWKPSWGNVPDIDELLNELDRLEAEREAAKEA